MPPAQDPLLQLFAELERSVSQKEDDKATKLCDKILSLKPDDRDALHCKVITLIRLAKFQDALNICSKKFTPGELVFEQAYCFYRTNRLSKALDLIRGAQQNENTDSRALRQLEAQVNYRLEDYPACLTIYHNLLQDMSPSDDEYNDVLSNYNAVKAALLFSGGELDAKYAPKDNTDTYELAYNSACTHIAQGDLAGAERLLETAKKLCRTSLSDEDYSEEEIERELAIIVVQLAYVYQLRGRVTEAAELYQSVLKTKVSDVSLTAVASNNLVAVHKDQELFDSAKKLKMAVGKELATKLVSHQKRVIAMNEALLSLYMHKYAVCKEMAQKLLVEYPDNDTLYLILAATSYHQSKGAKSLETLEGYARDRPTSLPIRFAVMQLQLLQSNHVAALATLDAYLAALPTNDAAARYRPALVALQVWLYEQTGQPARAMDALETASVFWRSNGAGGASGPSPASILKQTAAFKLKNRRYAEAANDYEQLVRADPTDAQAVAGLITALSEVDPGQAEKYGSSLPEIEAIQVDADLLEKNVPGRKRGYVRKEAKSDIVPVKKPKTRKKRRPLFPKNYDPSIPPDPHRWLPKRERAQLKGKGREGARSGKKAVGKGPQGAAVAGGGIGGTGSANIGGMKRQQSVVIEEVVEEKEKGKEIGKEKEKEKEKEKKAPASGGAGSNKNKKKGKGRGTKF